MLNIREIKLADAAEFIKLRIVLAQETSFLLPTLDELGQGSLESSEKMIASLLSDSSTKVLVAEESGELGGFVLGKGNHASKQAHVVSVVIGVLKKYWGRGIAEDLMREIHRWGENRGVMRFELTVIQENTRAIGFYRKMGYVSEGIRTKSILQASTLVDELYMGRITN